ncbi:Response regulator PleD [Marinomonas aquimarina]|uniref:diguanylate cyclase n=1 Tax=Marinomonas aquimarina TaxID=295068 RepID=A0A1A8TAT2_9GAMM|nr:sensor domain-containing diguanylate cyclase [Marinomonas aquimarina]SBS28651.1 Response regulator PleD [Marinomonas aquimarina]
MPLIRFVVRTDLRRLILMLTVASVLVTLGNSYFAVYNVQRQLLVENTLEANQRYAAKVAESAQMMLNSAQHTIAFSATLLAGSGRSEASAEDEVFRLVNQSELFNSAIVVNNQAQVVAAYPEGTVSKGYVLPENTRQSFYERAPLITNPFHSVSGHTIVSISHPIWGEHGNYLGYISGTIYLDENGSLSRLMREHFFTDHTYLYVVDEYGELLFHIDPKRVGENVAQMPLVQKAMSRTEGSEEGRNSKGIDMIAGYAPVHAANWGVVVQRPKEQVMASLNEQMSQVFWRSLPIVLLTLVVIWFMALLISRPLRQLARHAENVNDKDVQQQIVTVRSWYYEAAQLKMAVLNAIGLLNDKIHQLDADSQTDPLTSLVNRRGMQRLLDTFEANKQPFAILALDIDHFKNVNDRYGHDVGDLVIQHLALRMKAFLRDQDVACRVGGEEFLIFLPNTSAESAMCMAQSLCEHIASSEMPKVKRITVSIGVSCLVDHVSTQDMDRAIKQADTALYEAKNAGRNCVRSVALKDPLSVAETEV